MGETGTYGEVRDQHEAGAPSYRRVQASTWL